MQKRQELFISVPVAVIAADIYRICVWRIIVINNICILCIDFRIHRLFTVFCIGDLHIFCRCAVKPNHILLLPIDYGVWGNNFTGIAQVEFTKLYPLSDLGSKTASRAVLPLLHAALIIYLSISVSLTIDHSLPFWTAVFNISSSFSFAGHFSWLLLILSFHRCSIFTICSLYWRRLFSINRRIYRFVIIWKHKIWYEQILYKNKHTCTLQLM